jgi:hypothetical protein
MVEEHEEDVEDTEDGRQWDCEYKPPIRYILLSLAALCNISYVGPIGIVSA